MRELVLDLAATGRLLPRKGQWETRALKSLATKIGSGATPAGGRESYFGEGIPLIRWMNVHFRGFDRAGLVFLSDEQAEKLSNVVVKPNDVLLNITGASIGRVTIAPSEMAGARVNQHVTIIRPTQELLPRFLSMFLASPSVQRMIDEIQVGATRQALTKGMIEQFEIPLPLLAEQKRIVAKVDELMALCDRLEAQQQERETRHAALARASLARFAYAPTPANLQFLFHPSYTITPADLRKSILTLAVQGKLVPQDPNDEPADSILRETHSFFDRLVATKKLSAPKPLPPIEDDEAPFSLPIGWAWCRFGQIMRISSGDGLVAKDMNAGPIPVYGGNGVNGYHDAHNVAKRTLVIGRVGFYCGSIHVTPERAWVTDNAFITTFHEDHMDINFLSWLLKATDLRERDNATAQPVISGGKVYPTVLALPPLAEQRRIVAKVDQLMAQVDQLEAQLAASRATAANLLAALVTELTTQA
ncbi:MAG: restriction endonuclease subunit S [Chromatiaceae bacterium]|nr:restriction endonuclease subunit S [Chromatiaceae bacterium]